MDSSVRHCVRLALRPAILALGLYAALASADPRSFQIEAQDAASALTEFARQASTEVLFESAKLKGLRTNTLSGNYEPLDALAVMLKGTGLRAVTREGNVLVIEPESSNTAASSSPAALVASEQPPSTEVLEEIVVTAQKRAENAQSVPASISVLSGDSLSAMKLERLADYAAYVPGFNIMSGGSPGQATITLRGIAPVGPGAVVGTYIDDTPVGGSNNFSRASLFALDLMPYDLQRLEVLRGPQGTLYGAGSMGGLMKFVLRAADLDVFEGRIGADAASIDEADELGGGLRGMVNMPLVPGRLAIRSSAYGSRTPGYIDNAFTGERDVNEVRQYGGRVAATWQAADSLSVHLNAIWQRTKADDNSSISLGNLLDVAGPSYIVTGTPIFGEHAQSHAFAQPFRKDLDHYSATLNWDAGSFDLISATSWSQTATRQRADLTPSFGAAMGGLAYVDNDLQLDKLTQEIRLSSHPGGTFEWLIGGYYTNEDSDNFQAVGLTDADYTPIAVPYVLAASLPSEYQEYAAFGDVTWHLAQRFDITLGGRYARNEQEFSQITLIPGAPTSTVPGSSTESVFTWMTSARYRLTDDAVLYGRVATGYRPGGPNIALPGVRPTVDSDTLTNYELGIKSELFGRRALLNLALFYIDWKDIQTSGQAGPFNFLDNGGEAVSRGIELETAFVVSKGWRVGVNAAYTDAELTRASDVVGAPPFALHQQLPGVPEWSLALTSAYSVPLAGGWTTTVDGALRHVGERYSSMVMQGGGGLAAINLPAYEVLDLNASLAKGSLTFSLFLKNATGERAYLGAFPVNDITGRAVLMDVTLMQPRTIGIGIDVRL